MYGLDTVAYTCVHYNRSIEVVVPEDVGDLVLQVVAEDDDTGDDGVLSYSIVNVTRNSITLSEYPFAINSTTGAITTTQPLDEESYSYVITVLVTDMSTPPITTTTSYNVDFIGTYHVCIHIMYLHTSVYVCIA